MDTIEQAIKYLEAANNKAIKDAIALGHAKVHHLVTVPIDAINHSCFIEWNDRTSIRREVIELTDKKIQALTDARLILRAFKLTE